MLWTLCVMLYAAHLSSPDVCRTIARRTRQCARAIVRYGRALPRIGHYEVEFVPSLRYAIWASPG
jgi:hypothetical protein